jgi:chromosome condensin MukBEF ATPase and DNA-binding subunit MukB
MKFASTLVLVILNFSVRAQHAGSDSLVQIPGKYLSSVDKKIEGLDKQLTRQSEKYLHSLSKQEAKILRELSKLDSSRAKEMMGDTKAAYEQLSQKLNAADGKLDKAFSGQYLPYLDSLQGSLGFLKDAGNIVSKSKDIQQKLGSSLEQVKQIQNKLQQADEIKRYVQQRQEHLKTLLNNYTNLPKGITKHRARIITEGRYRNTVKL